MLLDCLGWFLFSLVNYLIDLLGGASTHCLVGRSVLESKKMVILFFLVTVESMKNKFD